MTFQEAEKTYKDLRSQHAAGKVTDADFESQVNQLKVQDGQGRWWQLGVRTGEWYYNDGQKWVKGKPPFTPAPAAPVPAPAPEPAAATPPPTASASTPTPAPVETKENKPTRPSVMPRGLFAAKPEGSEGGGLSRPVLIGIIAVAAVVIIALLVGAFFLVQSFMGGATARATTTPTQVAVLAPTSAPSATPAEVINTPEPTATLVVSATITPATAPRATATRAPAVARTATPTRPAAASPTPAPPPGLYVTKIALDRGIEANQPFAFRVTFFNNSGGPQHKDKWLVVIYRKNDLQEGVPERSIGETAGKTLDVAAGTADLVSDLYRLGVEGQPKCIYLAEAYYVGDNNIRVPFTGTNGKRFQFEFPFCQ